MVDSVQNVRTETKMQEKETLDERLPNLFEPDTLLPIQYFEAMRKKHVLEGEKRLVLSVLEDGIDCFMKCMEATTSKGQRLFREAEEWIDLEDKRWVFSFDNVCEMLDINPAYMRAGLRRWKERRLELLARRAEERARAATSIAAQPAAVEVPAAEPEKIAVGTHVAVAQKPRKAERIGAGRPRVRARIRKRA